MLAEVGDSRNAIAAFDRAISLVPGYADAKHNRAHAIAEARSL